MSTQITNQATLSFRYGEQTGAAESNIATVTLQGPLSAAKNSLFASYTNDKEITYILTLSNNSPNALANVTVTDNLGTYTTADSVTVTPLTYTGPAYLYINGVFSSGLVPVAGRDNVVFTLNSLPANSNAIIVYVAKVNNFALLSSGATITNLAEVTYTGSPEDIKVDYTLTAEDYADVNIVKSMSPNPVTGGGVLSYLFTIYNYGNINATNVILSDTFNPAPSNISVRVNDSPVLNTDYTYAGGTLTLPGTGSTLQLIVPAATFVQDPEDGSITTNPGIMEITVTGTV